LSKSNIDFSGRTIYVWLFVFSMLFSGGLIPTFLVVKEMGMLDTIWALTVPNAVMVFNIVLMLNFFRNLPKELEEASLIDGAGHWGILTKVYIPLSLPSIATILLFTIVGLWNEWFQGIIYMNRPSNYPLASYLQTIIIRDTAIEDAALNELAAINDRTTRSAQIFLGALPVLLVYPFLQKHFAKGITLGSVKE
jgi:putative aldouronate transport system permease protein